jgi:superfamily I DNA/RNA helicase
VKPLIDLAYDLIGRGVGCAVLGREIGKGLTDLVKKMKARGVDGVLAALEDFEKREVAKFMAKGEEGKAEAVSDRVACIVTIAGKIPEGRDRTVPALIAKIESLFTDSNGVLILSTMHKAKGREWTRVGILKPELLPSKWARQGWQQEQETNLDYVARTRARVELIYLEDDRPEPEKEAAL